MFIEQTRQVTVRTRAELPEWMCLAIKGERIPAIKALREAGGHNSEGRYMGLGHAKVIVENVMSGVTTVTED